MSSTLEPRNSLTQRERSRTELLKQIRSLRARPFADEIVQSPWSPVIDVPTLHADVKELIKTVVDNSASENITRCLTVRAAPGYGKTHLLAWTRQMAIKNRKQVFVFVPPYTAESTSFDQHFLRSVLVSLGHESQMELVRERLRQSLARAHARVNKRRWWSIIDWFRPSLPNVQEWPIEDQFRQLQIEFSNRTIFEKAFSRLQRHCATTQTSLCLDWNGFVVFALLTCGNEEQSTLAHDWLTMPWMSADDRRTIHLTAPCGGLEQARNIVFTLQQVLGAQLCFALDQVEDTYYAIQNRDLKQDYWHTFSAMVRALSETPGFSFLFMLQMVQWEAFKQDAPTSLIDRITASYGPQRLSALDERTSLALIQARMEAYVWNQLPEHQPPSDNPYFPFHKEEINNLRLTANRELRSFLKQAQDTYQRLLREDKLDPGNDLTPPPPIVSVPPTKVPLTPTPSTELSKPDVLTMESEHEPAVPAKEPSLNPTEKDPITPDNTLPKPIELRLIEHEGKDLFTADTVYIYGTNLSQGLRVLFGDQPAKSVRYEHRKLRIAAEPPEDLSGLIRVTVMSSDDPKNYAIIYLNLDPPEPPKPYSSSLNRKLIQEIRINLGLAVSEVCEKVKRTEKFIVEMERDENVPADSFFEQLAKAFNCTIRDFWDETKT